MVMWDALGEIADRVIVRFYETDIEEVSLAGVGQSFFFFFFSSRRRHTRSVSAFLLNRSSDLFLLLLSLLLPSLLIMFIPSTFKRPVSSWKALNLRKTLLMASSVRLKPLNCSRLPCVYAQETLTGSAGMPRSEERRVGKECGDG